MLIEYIAVENTTGTLRAVEGSPGEPQTRSEGFLGADAINDMMIFPDEPFPDYDWAANFDFAELNWTPRTFTGNLV